MTGRGKKRGEKNLFILLPDSVSHSNLPRFISLLLGISLRELISGQEKVCREINYKLFIVTEYKRAYRTQKVSKMKYFPKKTPHLKMPLPPPRKMKENKSHPTNLHKNQEKS